jgi:hypothetical protein
MGTPLAGGLHQWHLNLIFNAIYSSIVNARSGPHGGPGRTEYALSEQNKKKFLDARHFGVQAEAALVRLASCSC